MSRAEREAWQAVLDADPGLHEAWQGYRAALADAARQIQAGTDPDLDALHRAMLSVMVEAGEDAPLH